MDIQKSEELKQSLVEKYRCEQYELTNKEIKDEIYQMKRERD